MATVTVDRSVRLGASAADVWAVAITPSGVNAELMPLVRMTFPAAMSNLTSADITMGVEVCRCWMLGGGVLPFDRHALTFESIDDSGDGGDGAISFGFVETSQSWLQRQWRHERTVTEVRSDSGDVVGCEVRDVLTVAPRLPFAHLIVARVVPLVFEHRHRRLVARWGEPERPLHF